MALTSSIGTEHEEAIDAELALGNATTALSDAAEIGASEEAHEVIVRTTNTTYTPTGTISLQLQSALTEDGSYADVGGETIVPASIEIVKGVQLARLPIPKGVNPWIKLLTTTTDANEENKTVSVYYAYSPR